MTKERDYLHIYLFKSGFKMKILRERKKLRFYICWILFENVL